ncbi:hypothetical protein H4582DRAFT_2052018 [Lactarius indigo]|nr:hypothetical protein H4582DRAFT_2052018 [Lactarius indigo]
MFFVFITHTIPTIRCKHFPSYAKASYPAHVKKCEREQEERQGDKRYVKALEKRLRALDTLAPSAAIIPDEPLPCTFTAAELMDLDAGWGTSESVGLIIYSPSNTRRRTNPPPHKTEPWRPFFRTREDFVFSEVLMEIGVTKDQYDRLSKIVGTCIDGKGTLTLLAYPDMMGAWSAPRLN